MKNTHITVSPLINFIDQNASITLILIEMEKFKT